jgi:Ca-activated chloride channel family protein
VFLVLDISNSMAATDVSPTRLIAAKDAATEFVEGLPRGFNAALVAFHGTASLLVPPTSDRDKIISAIAGLQLGPSTAIGEGIYTALDAIPLIPPDPDHPDEPPGVAMVVLSDGESNFGRSSTAAAKQAKEDGVAVSTIAFGTPNGYIPDRFGRQPVPVNRTELKNIADVSGGKADLAESLEELREVYENIAQTVGYEMEETEITARFVGFAAIFGVIAVLGAMSLAARWP